MLLPATPTKLVSSAWYAASLCLSATVLLLDWTTVAETARFEQGTEIWRTRTEDFLNLGGKTWHRWNLHLVSNISYAGCSGLSRMVSAQFTLKLCIAAWNREKITKNLYFSGSRSSMLVAPESSSAVLVMISSKSVSICNRFYTTRANSGKITISKRVPLSNVLVRGESHNPAAPIYLIRN